MIFGECKQNMKLKRCGLPMDEYDKKATPYTLSYTLPKKLIINQKETKRCRSVGCFRKIYYVGINEVKLVPVFASHTQ